MDISQNYIEAVKAIKEAILRSQYRAAASVNKEQLSLYYGIGRYVSENSRRGFWGKGAVEQISSMLQKELPGLRGFSTRSIKNMRQFYLTFPNGYALRSELSWTHYRLLMRVENENAREFYMQEAVKSQWSTR